MTAGRNHPRAGRTGGILLMFGVGLHFSHGDLWRVRHIAVPGALLQLALSAALGYWGDSAAMSSATAR